MEALALDALQSVAEQAGVDPLVWQPALGLAEPQAAHAPPSGRGALAQHSEPTAPIAQQTANGAGGPAAQAARALAERGADAVASGLHDVLGQGQQLTAPLRQKVEQSLGVDLSQVRVHAGDAAEALADAVGAEAFATGSDVVLGRADRLAGPDRDAVLAEELIHVVQQGGQRGAPTATGGRSEATDRAERAARAAAEAVLRGTRVHVDEAEVEARALYRSPTQQSAETQQQRPEPPREVHLSIGGQRHTIALPRMQPGTTSKQVALPALDIPGLRLERNARLQFDPQSGQLAGGTAWARVALGQTVQQDNIRLQIGADGVVQTQLGSGNLTLGSLLKESIPLQFSAQGVQARGSFAASSLQGAQLQTWLRGGQLDVQVDSSGQAQGAGRLGLEVAPFGAGTLDARLAHDQLAGSAQVQATSRVTLAPGQVALQKGMLQGQLQGEALSLAGQLGVEVTSLPGAQGSAQVQWQSGDGQLSGTATLQTQTPANFGAFRLLDGQLQGQITASALGELQGQGQAEWAQLLRGRWLGKLDLANQHYTGEVAGGLLAPLVNNEVTVQNGALTAAIEAGALTSLSGNADFALGSFLTGQAALLPETSLTSIAATATASLVAPLRAGDATLSGGSMTVEVRGPQVSVAGGSVHVQYRDAADGTLELTPSAQVRQVSGTGSAQLRPGQVWGDLQVRGGSVQLAVTDNTVSAASGQATVGWKDVAEGQLDFDARRDFHEITGTVTAALTADVPLTAPLRLKADSGQQLQLGVQNSQVHSVQGNLAWAYESFAGQLAVATPVPDLQLVSGRGAADLSAPLPIGTLGSTQLLGQPGSKLTGVVQDGRFVGVTGQLAWSYDGFLAGKAQIAEPRQSIREIDGVLSATVTASKALPGNPRVAVRPGEPDALQIELRNSVPTRYSGTLAYTYEQWLQGDVHVAGHMLDFATLAGESSAKVVANKALGDNQLLPGSQLAVTFADSQLDAFSGDVVFQHSSWLKGKGTASKSLGASLSAGLAVQGAQGSLKTDLPGSKATGLQVKRGGKLQFDVVPGLPVSVFAAGSEAQVQYDGWLAGRAVLDVASPLTTLSGSAEASVSKEKVLGPQPTVALLPGKGLGVAFAAGVPVRFWGSPAARLQDWLQGQLAIAPSSGTQSLDGTLTGKLLAQRPLGGTGTTLLPGGEVSAVVQANQVQGLAGTLAFAHGQGQPWLQGTVSSAATDGPGLDHVSGAATAHVITAKRLGDVNVQPGGALQMPMERSQLPLLAGSLAFTYGQNPWLQGQLELAHGSTQHLVGGRYQGSVMARQLAGVGLHLQPGGTATGQVTGSQLQTLGGELNWQLGDWLAGTATAPEAAPEQLSGNGQATVQAEKAIIPGKLWMMPGGDLQATLTAGALQSLRGQVAFRWEDWATGTLDLQSGDGSTLAGSAVVQITETGKAIGSGAFAAKLLPGGALQAMLDASGLRNLSGQTGVEVGQSGERSLHVRGSAQLRQTQPESFHGDVQGGLVSPLRLPPALTIEQGGDLRFGLDGSQISQPQGQVHFALGRDGQPFVAGQLTLDAATTPQQWSGSVQGSVQREQRVGELTLEQGGQLQGTLTNNAQATLGGALAFRYQDVVRGQLQVNGQFNPDGQTLAGEAEASLMAPLALGPLTVQAGGRLGAAVADAQVTEVWGQLGVAVDPLLGTLEVPRGGSTLADLSGTASVGLQREVQAGSSGLVLQPGTGLQADFAHNQPGPLRGAVQFRYADWLAGTVALTGAELQAISGTATAQLSREKPVGSALFLQPGGELQAQLQDSALTQLDGQLAWQYGSGERWLAGNLQLQGSADLQSVSGLADAHVTQDARVSEELIVLADGSAAQANMAAGELANLRGQLGVTLGADQWLRGQATLAADSTPAVLGGSLQASVEEPHALGANWTVMPGSSANATLQSNQLTALGGQLVLHYGEGAPWLEGRLEVSDARQPEQLTGQMQASLLEPLHPTGLLRLDAGGSLQVQVQSGKIHTASGQVGVRYDTWLQGGLQLTSGNLDAPTGAMQAQLSSDKALGDQLLLRAGGGVEVELAQGQPQSWAGQVGWRYADWLQGSAQLAGGAKMALSGEGSAGLIAEHRVGPLTLQPGGALRAQWADSQLQGIHGQVAFVYEDWLQGALTLQAGATLTSLSGQATASLRADKALGNGVVARQGGNLRLELQNSQPGPASGQLELRLDDWLGGRLTLQPSDLRQHAKGELNASLHRDKQLGSSWTLLQGGQLTTQVDSQQAPGNQPVHGQVGVRLADWLQGQATLAQGSQLGSLSGRAQLGLVADKQVGELLLRRGGALQAQLTANQLGQVQGALNWQYQHWLGGTLQAAAGSDLTRPSGQGTAAVVADKPLGPDLTLLAGGMVDVTLTQGAPTALGGRLGLRYKSLAEGSLQAASSASLQTLSGTAQLGLVAPLALPGSELSLQPGGALRAQVQSGQLQQVSGQAAIRHGSWLHGRLEGTAPTLDGPWTGQARASLLTEKSLGAELTALPGGALQAQVQNNQLASWQGDVGVRWRDQAQGVVHATGARSWSDLQGNATLRLLRPIQVGSQLQILAGSSLQGQVAAGTLQQVHGKLRVQLGDWLAGTLDVTSTDLERLDGTLQGGVVADHALPGGLTLLSGGNLQAQLAQNALQQLRGEVPWQFTEGGVQLDGRLTLQPSTLDNLQGEATARLLADTPAIQDTRLRAGGHLQLQFAQSRPQTMGGQVAWQHQDWLGGNAEVTAGTKLAGPWRGRADARLLANKQVAPDWVVQQGGQLALDLDTSRNLREVAVSGQLAVTYADWLQGRVQLDPSAQLSAISGEAEVRVLANKSLGQDITLLAGGNLQTRLEAGGLARLGGVALIDYQQWLRGTVQLDQASVPDKLSGQATLGVVAAKDLGRLQVQPGGQLQARVADAQLDSVSGVVDASWDQWLRGQIQLDAGSTWQSVSGRGVFVTTTDKQLGQDWTLLARSNLRGQLQQGQLGDVGGEVVARYQDWLQAGLTLAPASKLDSLTGTGHVRTLADKQLPAQVVLRAQSSAQATLQQSQLTALSGTVGFGWNNTAEGQLALDPGATLQQVSGQAQLGLVRDQPLGLGVTLLQGGSASARLDGGGISDLTGQLALGYQDWARGRIEARTGSSLQSVSGTAELGVTAPKTVGPLVLLPPSQLAADFVANQPTEFRGNVAVELDGWLRGNVQFRGPDLNSLTGTAAVRATMDKRLAGPLSLLEGSNLRAGVQDSQVRDFGGSAGIRADGWGKGQLTVRDGSTLQAVSGQGQLDLDQPRALGPHVTMTRAVLGAEVEQSQLQHLWGEAHGQVKGLGDGWLRLDRTSTTERFDGQAGVSLTQPLAVGQFAELSGGEVIGRFANSELTSFGGWAQIRVHGWGSGRVDLDPASRLDALKGVATLTLDQPRSLAGGQVQILGGQVSASVDGQQLTHLAGSLEAELTGIARGRLQGEVDLQRQVVSGQGELQQLRDWQAGPARIHSGRLQATVSQNRLLGAAGSAQIDAGRYGQGQFQVNMEDVGGQPVFYGSGQVQFQPHERVQGTLGVHLTRNQKLTGEGDVALRISDRITARAGVALDEAGHVKLRGGVQVPGPFEIFAPRPYHKDLKLLDLSFVVYTPPTVKVKVGAGLGLDVGLKPLTLSNLRVGGECDLMDPGFASMAVTGQLSSSAYADLNAYVEGSVQVSAAVVAVQAGLRAALNLHLEAAIAATPTLRVDRNGLAFDMPVDARLTAALNLILTFFAKVRVGLDVGLFSIMKTVWQYDKSPDPLRLADMSIGAKGRVRAGGGGFSASMNPEYRPPNLSLDALKRALKLR